MLLTLALFAGAGVPASPAEGQRTRLGPYATRPRDGGSVTLSLQPPTVRIGLSGDGKSVLLASDGGVYIVDRETGRDVWKHIHKGPVRVVLEKSGAVEPPSVYRVQVASLSRREDADDLAARLQAETGEKTEVERNPDRNAWRVRVGQRATREEIAQVEEKLRALGFAETWIVEENGAGGRQPKMRLVDEDYNDMLTSSPVLLVLPAADGRPVQVDGAAYRGVVEVRITRGLQIRAVNLINVESYLRGVVPREMGPGVYPELEALKAQAVAARTYVEANRGQFSDDGFDICDTARCQVYGGIAAEHPLSDYAVEQTKGIIATWQGKPINALYTSTCGGHTEDLKNVFREMEGPYLKGVPCYPDDEALAASLRTLQGVAPGPPVVLTNGERIDGALALLQVLNVIRPEETTGESMAGRPAPAGTGAWMKRTLEVIGRRPPSGFDPARDVSTVSDLAVYLVEALDWGPRLDQLLDTRDLPSILGQDALSLTPEGARASLGYLVREGILPRVGPSKVDAAARDDGAPGPRDAATRGMMARALHRIILRYESAGLTAAKYRGFQGDAMALQSEGTLTFRPLAPQLHLVERDPAGGEATVAGHTLQDGDNLEFHLSSEGAVDYLLVKQNTRSSSYDRYSGVYSWETRIQRADLETKIRQRASIGRLIDLLPGRRGVSGRLLDLTVVGTAGRFTFRGFDIERLLGLRETLFLVERQYAPDGKVATFVFSGKGWGHGVGMCQVGAYGMALRGRTYEEILHHYYTGVTLEAVPPGETGTGR